MSNGSYLLLAVLVLALAACGGGAGAKKEDEEPDPLATVLAVSPPAVEIGVPVVDGGLTVTGTEFGPAGSGTIQFLALSGTPFNFGTQAVTQEIPVNIVSAMEAHTVGTWVVANVSESVPARVRLKLADGGVVTSATGLVTFVTAPTIRGPVRFTDVDQDNAVGVGDVLDVAFDQAVSLNAPVSGDFALAGAGGSLGAASFTPGVAAHEIRIILGIGAALTLQGSPGTSLDLSMNQTGVQSAAGGVSGVPTVPADLVPAFLEGPTLGLWVTRSIAVADLNGDGRKDIIAGNSGGNRIWQQDAVAQPGRGFSELGSPAIGGLNFKDTRGIAVAEIDGAGQIDFVTGNAATTANRVWLQDPLDSFSVAGTNGGLGLGSASTHALLLHDVNGDGFPDVLAGNDGANNLFRHNALSAGQGDFLAIPSQALGSGSTRSLALGNVDGVGGLDLLAGNLGANFLYLHNAGAPPNGAFGQVNQTFGLADSHAVAFGDFNGDGFDDMLEGNANLQANRIYLNNGLGPTTFFDGPTAQELGSGDTRAVVVGDIDLDGRDDFVSGNALNQPDRVWLNRGDGSTFVDLGQALGAEVTYALALVDLDGDGDLDLVAGTSAANRIWWGSASVP